LSFKSYLALIMLRILPARHIRCYYYVVNNRNLYIPRNAIVMEGGMV
jgi:hypothetical protein